MTRTMRPHRPVGVGSAPGRDWRDRRFYRSLLQLDRTDLDWIFAERHPALWRLGRLRFVERVVRADPPLTVIVLDPGDRLPRSWGLRFRADGAPPLAFWRATVDPTVLAATARRAPPGDSQAFDLARFGLPVVVLRSGGIEHVLIADGPRRIRCVATACSMVRCGCAIASRISPGSTRVSAR